MKIKGKKAFDILSSQINKVVGMELQVVVGTGDVTEVRFVMYDGLSVTLKAEGGIIKAVMPEVVK